VVRHNALTDPGAEIPGTMLGPDVETNVLRHGSVSIDLLRAMLWVSLCLSSVVQAAIDDRRWCETQTARFTLVSDLKPERLQPIADDLLRFHAVAELLVPQDTSKQLPPLTIFAFKSARLLRSTFNVQSVSGLSLASHDGFTLVYGPRYGKRSLSSMTAFHEYSHYLMLSRPALKYPLWYGEGLASLLSTMEFPDLNTARVGIVPPVRLRNATRDYLDFAALADRLGTDRAAAVALDIDNYYEDQQGAGGRRIATQVARQLADPRPDDLSEIDLRAYRRLEPRWQAWEAVADICRMVAVRMLDRLVEEPS